MAESEPEFDERDRWIWRAWDRLSTDREHIPHGFSVAMGGTVISARPRPIRWRDVMEWADRNYLSQDDTDLLERCLIVLDREFMQWWKTENSRPLSTTPGPEGR